MRAPLGSSNLLTASCLLFAFTMVVPAWGQTAAPPQVPRGRLVVVERVVLPSFADRATLVPIKSDREGDIYFRFGPGRAPIMEVGDDGSQLAQFRIDSIPGDAFGDRRLWGAAWVSDFCVAPNGDLYAMVNSAPKSYLVEFSLKGEYERTTGLRTKEPAFLAQLVCLPANRFFVTGSTYGSAASQWPVNAIFSGNGDLVTDVSLAGDVQPPKEGIKPGAQENGVAPAVDMGTALAGDDGNIYLMRESSPAQIFVIGPDGKLVRKLAVQSPMDGGTPDTFKVHGGRVAVLFMKPVKSPKGDQPDEIIYRVVDATMGAVLGDYVGGAETSRWAGYNDNGFLFLGAKDGKLTRVRAIPQ